MAWISRRNMIGASVATAALPRVAISQTATDTRPVITVAVQVISTSNTIDLLSEQSNVGTRISPLFSETLIGLNYQGQLEQVPGLATSWRRIDDRTVEMALRPGVKFHNGDEMTAEDVAFSFGPDHMFGTTRPSVQGKTLATTVDAPVRKDREMPAQIPPIGRRLFPGLDRVDIVDKYTVRFVNATPDVTLEGRLSQSGSQILSRRAFDAAPTWLEFARQPVGTGPYKVRRFDPDTMLIFDAHDEYWGGRPPIKTIRFVQVPEVSSRVNGLLSGEYQFACDIPPDQIASIEGHPGFEVQGGTIPNHRILIWDEHLPALRDPRVRLAMAHAIDRQAIVDSLWAGRTRIPAGLQWEFYGDMFVKGWTVPEFDATKAGELLKAAGYKGDPIPYRLVNNYYTNQVATAQVMVEMWRQVGLNVELQMMENGAQAWSSNGQRGVLDWSNSAVFNDPVSSIVAQHGPNGQQQQTGQWTNAEMNKLSLELETSTDRPRRHDIFARMLQICEREDPAYTVLHQNATFTAKRRDIHWKAAPSFAMDFRANNFSV
jgi:peptide/nickel transport system substrate-binding protein